MCMWTRQNVSARNSATAFRKRHEDISALFRVTTLRDLHSDIVAVVFYVFKTHVITKILALFSPT